MSGVSGVVSRQVLPACGNLCFFCPGLRARSRQPVKRYKKLIADIFPRNQVCLHILLIFRMPNHVTLSLQEQLLIPKMFNENGSIMITISC